MPKYYSHITYKMHIEKHWKVKIGLNYYSMVIPQQTTSPFFHADI